MALCAHRLVGDAVSFLEVIFLLLKILWIVARDGLLGILPKRQKSLLGDVVLITGGGQGMGRQVAINIARMGAKVVLWDVNEAKVMEVADVINKEGGRAFWYVCDVTSESEVKAKALKVEEEVGEVTILLNNAGVLQNLPILQLDSARIRQTLDVNLLSHFWTIRAFLPNMEKKNSGHIVAIASSVGLFGYVNQTDYSASKHGVIGLMEAFAEELRLKGSDIKLTTICPLAVNTGLIHNTATRCSWLLPVVSMEDAANDIISAIRREDFIVSIPSWTLCLLRLFRLLPKQCLIEVFDFAEYCRVPNSSASSTQEPTSH